MINNDIIPINNYNYDPLTVSLSANKIFIFDVRNIESSLDYNFTTFLRSLCIKDRKSETYKLATDNLDTYLDIKTLFDKYSEISMMKELIFNPKQSKLFDILSKFINLKHLFHNEDSIVEEDENISIAEILVDIKELETKGTKYDKKLLANLKLLFRIDL